ncbi:heme-dependent oxidative N-demethylase family protein [Stagnihabitans tardus]|uniref:DUF3445 domain-containing protein n=1 Tax=Stagnihabitans tardus TaxID=2699202 RepID=A0AAE5BT01_9RHOB|nr:DUF3445 domain-containing protein [Stagnihabitans tardus]NBZ86061.1 DUF3445 domain-containing protein [Stagnihabitans tardus]
MEPILQTRLDPLPWTVPALWRLPGIVPMQMSDWLRVDDAYAAQMAERERLIATAPVHALTEEARPAAEELYDTALAHLPPGFTRQGQAMRRPDGVLVELDRSQPLLTLGRLLQEDFCLMEARGEEHVLTGAILCFPASWTLAEKLGHPLTTIHVPVKGYAGDLARRVQRLFDMIRPGQPLYRMNALLYANPALHQPKSQTDYRPRSGERPFMRSERQSLVRLPLTGAVVFSIHTVVMAAERLSPADIAILTEQGH